MTKEERQEYNKKYNEANKEERAAKREANKEKLYAYDKDYRESQKDGLYTVYYLKEEHYAGMTNSLSCRLRYHKSVHNRHVEDVEVIGKYETKAEAIRVEAALHAMGYNGRHPRDKQQTLKEVL
jgi:hypothetical protein